MASRLGQYWEGDYRSLSDELQLVTDLIAKTLALFGQERFFGRHGWLYEISSSGPAQQREYSQSTNAMITWAVQVLIEPSRVGVLAPIPAHRRIRDNFWPRSTEDPGKPDRDQRQKILNLALSSLSKVEESITTRKTDSALTESGTFGDDDPMTLGWLLELKSGDNSSFRTKVGRRSAEWVVRASKVLTGERWWEGLPESRKDSNWSLDMAVARDSLLPDYERTGRFRNAFWALRWGHVAQLLERVGQLDDVLKDQADLRRVRSFGRTAETFFRDRLHEHIAFGGTTDFDPGELVFALEGLVVWGAQPPPVAVLDRVFQALQAAQETAAYWRPTRPIVRNSRGQVLFPLSVEVAQSLLRVLHRLQAVDPRRCWFAQNLVLLSTYVEWVRAQLAKVDQKQASEPVLYGWHSEYDPTRRSIHTWQTSQVIVFLAQYAYQLQRHLEERLRVVGQFNVLDSPRVTEYKAPEDAIKEKKARWQQWAKENEPMRSSDESATALPYEVLRRIGDEFIYPRLSEGEPAADKYSFILYGPPGTGKTTQAHELATTLEMPLIVVTTSDFLMGGESELEARAKSIFNALMQQSEAIVLFDELDRLLLDRQSKGYSNQSALFQFMTPGMLTKFQDLRGAAGPIFILATNHRERMDPAIKRLGRIDRHYLLLPPNFAQRKHLLDGFLRQGLKEEAEIDDALQEAIEDAAGVTPFCVWGELEQIAANALRDAKKTGALAQSLLNHAQMKRPALRLDHYKSSFRCSAEEKSKFEWTDEPLEDVLMLLYLLTERIPPDEQSGVLRQYDAYEFVKVLARDLGQKDEWKSEIKDEQIRASLSETIDTLSGDSRTRSRFNAG